MNLLYFLMSYQFSIFLLIHLVSAKSLEEFVPKTLSIKPTDGTNPLILRSTDHKLANVNLPIWSVHENNPDVLHLETDVMEKLGPFDIFQNSNRTSAVIFFENRKYYSGIIDYYYIMDGGIYDNEDNVDDEPSILTLRKRNKTKFGLSDCTSHLAEELEVQVEINEGLSTAETKALDTFDTESQTAEGTSYIETLVIVNHDIAQEFGVMNENDEDNDRDNEGEKQNIDEYVAVVTYVLSLFNSVDMLYSKIKNPKIKINIRGIIISNGPESLLELNNKCFKSNVDDDKKIFKGIVDATCCNEALDSLTQNFRNTYDLVLFLTGNILYRIVEESGVSTIKILAGHSTSPILDYYETILKEQHLNLRTTVTDQGEFESFPIIAHEIAHLITLTHDNLSTSGINIMKGEFSVTCPNSFEWSEAAISSFKQFFTSPARCWFKNEPQSLYPGPRKLMTLDEQCRCYGYERAYTKLNFFVQMFYWVFRTEICKKNIICINGDKTKVVGPVFQEGTECGKNKVCWDQKCQKV